MKHIVLMILACVFSIGNIYAQEDGAVIAVEKSTHDFGKINEINGPVSYTFTVKNEGTAPLVMTRVVASCGCTTPVYTKEPIAPGSTGEIAVTFDPKGRPGPFTKTISVYSNGKKGSYILTIRGEVL